MPAEIDENWFAPGRAHQAHRRGRGVLLVILVQDQQALQRARHHRVDLVHLGQHAEVQLQEVVHEAERVVGVQERLPDALLVRVRRDDRKLRQHADRVELDVLGIVGVGLVLVVRRQRRDGRREHRHRVRGMRQRREEPLEVLVQKGVPTDLLVELPQLVGRGQLAVDEQPRDLEICAVLRQLLDRIAAVTQHALVTVDVGDRRLGRRGVHEAVVESRVAGLAGEGGEVHARRAVGAPQQRELGGRITDREGGLLLLGARVAHGASSRFLVVPGVSSGPERHRGAVCVRTEGRDGGCRVAAFLQPSAPLRLLLTRPKGRGIRWRNPHRERADAACSRSAAAAMRSSVAVSDSRMCCGKCTP